MSNHVTSCQYDTCRNVATTVEPAPQIKASANNDPSDITSSREDVDGEDDDDDDDTEEVVEEEGDCDDARLRLVEDEKCEA